tara:strand:+ start:7251 stop:8567 length:1317 start_codon:yes stop_codon:yes gene_type:complete
MLAAVEFPNPYDGLDGYVYIDGVPPKRKLDWINPSKAETTPFSSVVPPTITASAAHPGKKSNNCIPYTRVCSLSASCLAGEQGEVTFVSAMQRALLGAGQNKLSVSMGWQKLNSKLANHVLGETTLRAEENPFFDWKKVAALREWRLDGVVLSNPNRGENGSPTYDSIDGEMVETSVLNICIDGVCPIVNVFGAPNCGDILFLGLVASKTRDYWSFEICPCTHTALSGGKTLAPKDIKGLVGAWKIGQVVDSAAAAGKLTINVSVEWVPTHAGPDEVGLLFERYSTTSAPALSDLMVLLRAEEAREEVREEVREDAVLDPRAKKATAQRGNTLVSSTSSSSVERPTTAEFAEARTVINRSNLDYDLVYTATLRVVAGQAQPSDVETLRNANTMLTKLTVSNRKVVKYIRANTADGDPIVAKWVNVHERVRMAMQKSRP